MLTPLHDIVVWPALQHLIYKGKRFGQHYDCITFCSSTVVILYSLTFNMLSIQCDEIPKVFL
jgi:hypothetical protein